MSVYTPIDQEQASAILSTYDLGQYVSLTPIESGIENSNYFLTSTKGEFVLTIFEAYTAHDLPYFFEIMTKAGHALPVPSPIVNHYGDVVGLVAEKPYAIFPRIPGEHIQPEAMHCAEIGKFLGQFHETFYDFHLARHNPRPIRWFKDVYDNLSDQLKPQELALFDASLGTLEDKLWAITEVLPYSTIHGDLFHDNALIENGMITAVLDFYSAFTGPMLFDIAVTANDWCRTPDNALDPQKLKALLTAYQKIRPLTSAEKEYAFEVFYWAAFRFWVSRLEAWYQPRKGELILTKDPDEFAQLLRFIRYHFEEVFDLAISS